MASNGGHPPLLILTNSIYAKRKDGTFHPGCIEDKNLDTYTVKFNDGAREGIVEGDLTWLGFWGMPPWSWPTAPLIQPAMSWKAFEERAMPFRQEESEFQGFRPSFAEQRTDDTLLERPGSSEASQTNGYTSSPPCSKEQDSSRIPKASSPTNHSRSGVLRFNQNVLSKETNFEDISLAFTTAKSKRTSTADTSPPSRQTMEKRSREKRSEFESVFTSDVEATRTTNTNEEYERNMEKGWSPEIDKEMTDYSHKRRRHSFPETSTHEEERRMTNNDLKYFTRNRLNTYESDDDPFTASPHHVMAPQVPFFGQPFGMAILGTSSRDSIPYSFQIQPKTRKRSEKKKCRKVYGIENRHFWCTQCRWKKACTRFASSNRIISSEFV